jgi:hypothetical protein
MPMTILDHIKKWFAPAPRYKIIHDPQFGFCACYKGEYGWCSITEYGDESVQIGSGFENTFRSTLFVSTVEAAGERINLHANNRGRSVVWTEPTT